MLEVQAKCYRFQVFASTKIRYRLRVQTQKIFIEWWKQWGSTNFYEYNEVVKNGTDVEPELDGFEAESQLDGFEAQHELGGFM